VGSTGEQSRVRQLRLVRPPKARPQREEGQSVAAGQVRPPHRHDPRQYRWPYVDQGPCADAGLRYHHNVAGGFLALKPSLYAADQGQAPPP